MTDSLTRALVLICQKKAAHGGAAATQECQISLKSLAPATAEHTEAHERGAEKRQRRRLGNRKFLTARYMRGLRACGTGQREQGHATRKRHRYKVELIRSADMKIGEKCRIARCRGDNASAKKLWLERVILDQCPGNGLGERIPIPSGKCEGPSVGVRGKITGCGVYAGCKGHRTDAVRPKGVGVVKSRTGKDRTGNRQSTSAVSRECDILGAICKRDLGRLRSRRPEKRTRD